LAKGVPLLTVLTVPFDGIATIVFVLPVDAIRTVVVGLSAEVWKELLTAGLPAGVVGTVAVRFVVGGLELTGAAGAGVLLGVNTAALLRTVLLDEAKSVVTVGVVTRNVGVVAVNVALFTDSTAPPEMAPVDVTVPVPARVPLPAKLSVAPPASDGGSLEMMRPVITPPVEALLVRLTATEASVS
jgi:hypothetical protein